jgi:hypothetical protein
LVGFLRLVDLVAIAAPERKKPNIRSAGLYHSPAARHKETANQGSKSRRTVRSNDAAAVSA